MKLSLDNILKTLKKSNLERERKWASRMPQRTLIKSDCQIACVKEWETGMVKATKQDIKVFDTEKLSL